MLESVGRRPQAAMIGWGGVLAIGVGLPLFSGGAIWLLDWVIGLRTPLAPGGAFGLSGGLVTGVPFALVANCLVRIFGGPGTWLPLVAFFPIAACGVSRLVGGSRWSRLGAATLYCVNPFVFQRIYVGHFGLLLGYALLPFALTSAIGFVRSGIWWMPVPALWWAVLTALSPHFAWIYGVALVAVWLTHHPVRLSSVSRLGAVGAMFALLSTYILLPHTATQLSANTGTNNLLSLYRTTGDPHLGLFPNVLGLYGFWRLGPGPTLPKNVVSGWPFLLLALLFVVAIGAVTRLRSDRGSGATQGAGAANHRIPAALLIIGIAGYFLALGDQGPTGPLFRWAYFHVPFFAVMEEPQKFLMLTALAYAVFFGWGVERLTGTVDRLRLDRRMLGAASLAVLLPLAYTPTIFDGLAGQIAPSHLPASWQTADRLMGNGPGQILFLPWHLYLSFPFTDGRVIANPAPTSFRRAVISGDNVEASTIESASTSPRSAYLTHLFALGPSTHDFGSEIAPLGVKFVVLAKTVDWFNYSWVAAQPDLRLVMDSASLEVWRNSAYAGVGRATGPRSIHQISPVAYAIGPGIPGSVSLDAPYQKGWELSGEPARRSAEGTLLFEVGRAGGVARFAPWGLTRLGYIISGTAFLLLSAAVVADRVRRRALAPPGSPL
ncbi:MAG: hypothetical protein ACYDD4_07930 [Acidimicrobiales bacterium]